MRLFAKLSISFFLVLIFSFPGKGINPLYTREIPPETPFAVPPSISVFQDPETGNIVSQQLGEIKILINKNPTPSPEAVSYTHLDVYKRQGLIWGNLAAHMTPPAAANADPRAKV